MIFHSKTFCSKSQQGFTLVELLVVIFIIGVLASLLVTNFVGIRGRASDTSKKNDLQQLKTALRLYYNDYQQFPVGNAGVILGCGETAAQPCSAGSEFRAGAGATLYMKELPSDFAYYSSGGDSFVAVTLLDNLSDEALQSSQESCDLEARPYFSGEVTPNMYVVCES
jgi:type II secretion system protein G